MDNIEDLKDIQKDIISENDFYDSLKKLGFKYKGISTYDLSLLTFNQSHINGGNNVCYGIETYYNEDLGLTINFMNYNHKKISELVILYDFVTSCSEPIPFSDCLYKIRTIVSFKVSLLKKKVDKYSKILMDTL